MASIARATNADDLKAQEKIGSWPSIETISTTHFAAVKLMSTSPDAVELVKLMGTKSVPGLIWVDAYGNPILSQPMPDVAASITYVIANWKSTLASVDKFFKDHQARGDIYVKNGKLREAYVEYSMLAKFKGPNADKAKDAKALVTASWLKVAVAAAKLPVGSRDSLAMLKGLREEVKSLDFAAVLEKELLNAMIANDAAKTAVAVADGENKPAPVPVESTPAPAVAAPEIQAAPVAEAPVQTTRPLAELARTSTPASREPSESVINVSYLVSSTNPALKQAGEALKKGMASYQKATADSMERGEPRNALLRSAHEDFDKTITLIENALAAKPDDVVRRLEERVSMMLYASLKYQSL